MTIVGEILRQIKNKLLNGAIEDLINYIDDKLEKEGFGVNIEKAIRRAKVEKLFSKDPNIEKYQIIPQSQSSSDYHYLKIMHNDNVAYSITLQAYISADEGRWGSKCVVGEFEIGHPHYKVIYKNEDRNCCKEASDLLAVSLVKLTSYLREYNPELKQLLY